MRTLHPHRLLTAGLLTVGLLLPATAFATVYQCVDEKGRLIFSDSQAQLNDCTMLQPEWPADNEARHPVVQPDPRSRYADERMMQPPSQLDEPGPAFSDPRFARHADQEQAWEDDAFAEHRRMLMEKSPPELARLIRDGEIPEELYPKNWASDGGESLQRFLEMFPPDAPSGR